MRGNYLYRSILDLYKQGLSLFSYRSFRQQPGLRYVSFAILALALITVACSHSNSGEEWKSYQEDFRELRARRLEAALRQAQGNLNPADTLQLNKEIAALSGQFKSAQYRSVIEQINYYQGELHLLENTGTLIDSIGTHNSATDTNKSSDRTGRSIVFDRGHTHSGDRLAADSIRKLIAFEEQKLGPTRSRYDSLIHRRDSINAIVRNIGNQIEETRSSPLEIKEIKLSFLNSERCTSCHLGITDTLFRSDTLYGGDAKMAARWMRANSYDTAHYTFSKHGDTTVASVRQVYRMHPNVQALLATHKIGSASPVIGCTSCHAGNGSDASSVAAAHGSGSKEILQVGAVSQANCISCHRGALDFQGAPIATAAAKLFNDLACTACHKVNGFEQANLTTSSVSLAGPSLRNISKKVTLGWLIKWVQNPHAVNGRAHMPSAALSEDDAKAVAAYLFDQSKNSAYLSFYSYMGHGDGGRGEALFHQIGCFGCHTTSSTSASVYGRVREGNTFGPDLSSIAGKVRSDWLFDWLKHPKNYDVHTRMPSLRLSDAEANDLTAYLLGLKGSDSGKVESSFIRDNAVIEHGKQIVAGRGCANCHEINGIDQQMQGGDLTKTGADMNAIQTALSHHTPDYSFSKEELTALSAMISGLNRKPQGKEGAQPLASATLIYQYNCRTCHVINNSGALTAGEIPDLQMRPPYLLTEGSKVQADWFVNFLHGPTMIRPGLKVRMPSYGFSDSTISQLWSYFTSTSPKFNTINTQIDSADIMATGAVVTKQCMVCHAVGNSKIDPTKHAPNLSLTRRRLTEAWLIPWLHNPARFQPGTTMPAVWGTDPRTPNPFPALLNGNTEMQIAAETKYLLAAGTPTLPTASAYSSIWSRNIFVGADGGYEAPRYLATLRIKPAHKKSVVKPASPVIPLQPTPLQPH